MKMSKKKKKKKNEMVSNFLWVISFMIEGGKGINMLSTNLQ